jgi:toxin YoeB
MTDGTTTSTGKPRTARFSGESINQLIEDISRNENTGIGKPERLRHEWAGWWSRRITQEHRLVYRVVDDGVEIAICRFHYGK